MSETPTKISKSEHVRAEFANEDYLAFNELHSRIVFTDQDLTSLKSRSETVKFAVKFTTLAVRSIVGTEFGGVFIEDNPQHLMFLVGTKATAPLTAQLNELAPLLRALNKVNNTIEDGAESVSISASVWSDIMAKVASLSKD